MNSNIKHEKQLHNQNTLYLFQSLKQKVMNIFVLCCISVLSPTTESISASKAVMLKLLATHNHFILRPSVLQFCNYMFYARCIKLQNNKLCCLHLKWSPVAREECAFQTIKYVKTKSVYYQHFCYFSNKRKVLWKLLEGPLNDA